MKFKLLSITAISFILFSCGNGEQKQAVSEENITEQPLTNESKLEEIKTEASRLRAGGSIKNVELVDEKATITYVSNYKEYKEVNPQSSLSENELKAYWESGDAIKKALNDGSVRIMKKLSFLNEVKIVLPYNKETYEIVVNKSEFEKFIGKDFNTIIEDWDNSFSNPYVYDKKGREEFFNNFGLKK